jgi:ABC-type lipoprotein release transport system permease subunit
LNLKIIKDLIILFISDRTSRRFAVGAWLGLAFSIAVILATIGIMDGFVDTLKRGLRSSSGDLTITSRDGFFGNDSRFLADLQEIGLTTWAPFVQTEAFALFDGVSKGVLVRGIETESYAEVTGTKVQFGEREVAIGSELARVLGIKVGDQLGFVFASGSSDRGGLPTLENFRVSRIIEHGVYQTDLRLVFMRLEEVQQLLELGELVNMITLNAPDKENIGHVEQIENFAQELRFYLGPNFSVSTYWSEFSYLVRVVKVEKVWIGMILQIIVIISIFNVLAFIIFINDQKSRELFLFKALGLSQRNLLKIWYGFVFVFWLLACLCSLLFVVFFEFLLGDLSVLNLPADVYHLGRLSLSLSLGDFVFVFSVALAWLGVLSWLGLRRLSKQSVLYGLRREFS